MKTSLQRALGAAAAVTSFVLFTGTAAAAQDNILIYGNSIIQGVTTPFLSDIIEQTGATAPNLVTAIFAVNGNTTAYVASDGLISSSLPAGDTWKAMVIEGGTYETTMQLGFDPAVFQANMLDLAGTFYGHSPQGLFVGHETGADHPNDPVYPGTFPNAAYWLNLSQTAYATARANIIAAHPSSPPAKTAHQGTVFAATAGYPFFLFDNDLHHHTDSGKLLTAMLYYQVIYGAKIRDLNVDFTQSTPLVTRLNNNGINEALWTRLVGLADRSLPPAERLYPGSEDDFQLRFRVNSGAPHTLDVVEATAGDTLRVLAFSPLDTANSFAAAIYLENLPTAQLPATVGAQGWHLRRSQQVVFASMIDLNGGPIDTVIPGGLAGSSYLLQSISRMHSPTANFLYAVSDAKVVHIQ